MSLQNQAEYNIMVVSFVRTQLNVGLFGGVVAAFGVVVIILITILLVVVIVLIKFRRKTSTIATSSCE